MRIPRRVWPLYFWYAAAFTTAVPCFYPSLPADAAEHRPPTAAATDSAASSTKTPSSSPFKRYRWQPDEVYRFNYWKRTTVAPQGNGAAPRVTEISGILIFEIKKVADDGTAAALMRFDVTADHLRLPLRKRFSSAAYEPKNERPEKTAAAASAMAAAMADANRRVLLEPSGAVRVLSREPDNLKEWLRGVNGVIRGRKKRVAELPRLLQKTLGVESERRDTRLLLFAGQESFPAPLPPSENTAAEKGKNDKVAPRVFPFYVARRFDAPATKTQKTSTGVKLLLSFHHKMLFASTASTASPSAGEPAHKNPTAPQREFTVPGAAKHVSPVKLHIRGLKTLRGKAVFDPRLGMLERLDEAYVVKIELEQKGVPGNISRRTVRIEYRLTRLAPPPLPPKEIPHREEEKPQPRRVPMKETQSPNPATGGVAVNGAPRVR